MEQNYVWILKKKSFERQPWLIGFSVTEYEKFTDAISDSMSQVAFLPVFSVVSMKNLHDLYPHYSNSPLSITYLWPEGFFINYNQNIKLQQSECKIRY
jgi:hypothetical protein